jgi:hypothetical protein
MLAVRDAITARIFTASAGCHFDLIIAAERELGIAHQNGNDRFVCGYLDDENGEFVTGITKQANEQRR